MRPDPAREPELFPVDEIPATNPSSPLSSCETEREGDAAAPGVPEEFAAAQPVEGISDPDDDLETLFARLARSEFRSRFRLRTAERTYIEQKGLATLRRHAEELVRTRLAPAQPLNDGRQTPMRGHPVFIAQHATGCCCRGCLAKWHGIPAGRPLTEAEQRYVVRVLLTWISRQLGR